MQNICHPVITLKKFRLPSNDRRRGVLARPRSSALSKADPDSRDNPELRSLSKPIIANNLRYGRDFPRPGWGLRQGQETFEDAALRASNHPGQGQQPEDLRRFRAAQQVLCISRPAQFCRRSRRRGKPVLCTTFAEFIEPLGNFFTDTEPEPAGARTSTGSSTMKAPAAM